VLSGNLDGETALNTTKKKLKNLRKINTHTGKE
jgi:hypothetical protein